MSQLPISGGWLLVFMGKERLARLSYQARRAGAAEAVGAGGIEAGVSKVHTSAAAGLLGAGAVRVRVTDPEIVSLVPSASVAVATAVNVQVPAATPVMRQALPYCVEGVMVATVGSLLLKLTPLSIALLGVTPSASTAATLAATC
jgi:hypothetical protein